MRRLQVIAELNVNCGEWHCDECNELDYDSLVGHWGCNLFKKTLPHVATCDVVLVHRCSDCLDSDCTQECDA